MISFLKNYLSTTGFIWAAYFFYHQSEYHMNFLQRNLSFFFSDFVLTTENIFLTIVLLYTVILIPYYFMFSGKSKARIVLKYFLKVLWGYGNIPDEREKTAILAWIVKLFFAPLMIIWLTDHIFNLVNNIHGTWISYGSIRENFISFFDNHFFWTAFSLILFLDVFFFTMGYLIETPYLKNTIKSVEPTLLWWFVALICYPPFNSSLNSMVGWYSSDFPKFENGFFHIFFACLVLLLMGMYSWASVSLGWKASNLTNRGIVTTGLYKYIRHPAYICKNTAWWIGGLPFLGAMLTQNNVSWFFVGLFSLCTWSGIYYLRAMTEEAHLSLDEDYREYKKKVPYRFIPKIF